MAEVFYPLVVLTFSLSREFLECPFSVGAFLLYSETLNNNIKAVSE